MRQYFNAHSLLPACRIGRAMATAAVVLMLAAGMVPPVGAATTEPVLRWTEGGLSAGIDSAGQAARMAVDARGNVAIVSGPAGGRNLAVTSYTENGVFRWRSTVSPASGTFVGDWVVAAQGGDFLAVGHSVNSSGDPIQATLVRFDTNGAVLWRVEPAVGFLPTVGRLVVDADGNAYLAVSGRGSGMFVQKYAPSGALLWSQRDATGSGYALASSLALSPDGADVVVTGGISGGASWNTIAYDTATGIRKWQVTAAEGTTAKDVVVDVTRVYVTGQGVTGAGTPALKYFLTVIAYDRATGKRLWRTDRKPADGSDGFGLRMAMAPDGSLAVTGQTNRGFLDWYTVAFETTGAVRWEAVRDGKLNTDEIPRAVLVMPDGTTVVTGRGGPNLAGGYIPGVTAGYSSSGQLLWVAFSTLETVWAAALPNGDVRHGWLRCLDYMLVGSPQCRDGAAARRDGAAARRDGADRADGPDGEFDDAAQDRSRLAQYRQRRQFDHGGTLYGQRLHCVCSRRSAHRDRDRLVRRAGQVEIDLFLSPARQQYHREFAILQHRDCDGALSAGGDQPPVRS